MNISANLQRKRLAASCPSCRNSALYSTVVLNGPANIVNKEILVCKMCRFIMAVDELKKMLWRK